MKKHFSYLFLACFLLTACGSHDSQIIESSSNAPESQISSSIISSDESSNSSSEEEKGLSGLALKFVTLVNSYQEVTLDSKDDLDLMLVYYYGAIQADETLVDNEEIIAAKTKLDEFYDTYNRLKKNSEDTEVLKAYEDRFIAYMDTLPPLNSFLLTDYEKLLTAQNYYSALADVSKEKETIIPLKELLDNYASRYEELSALSSNSYNVILLSVNVSKIDVEKLTYADIAIIDELKDLDDSIVKSSLDSDELANLNAAEEILNAALDVTAVLKVRQKHAEDFIALAYQLPVSASLRYQDTAQRNQIQAAIDQYNALTDEEKLYSGVEDAYQNVLSTKATFEGLKEPYDLNVIGVGFDTGAAGTITYSVSNPIVALANRYGYNVNEINNYLKINLYVYAEGGMTLKDNVPAGILVCIIQITSQNYSLINRDYLRSEINKVKEAGGTASPNGAYALTLQIESLNDQYGSSYFHEIFGRQQLDV